MFHFLVLRFDTLKKGYNFNSIENHMMYFTLWLEPLSPAFVFVDNDLAFRWRDEGSDGVILERIG